MKKKLDKVETAVGVVALLAIAMIFSGIIIGIWFGTVGLKIAVSALAILIADSWMYEVVKRARNEAEKRRAAEERRRKECIWQEQRKG